MTHTDESRYQHRILTIPNVISLLRIFMIPLFIWLYLGKNDDVGTAVVLILSGVTDALDGFIARRFHMVSDVGKALDPVADKLTQIAMLFCLVARFPLVLLPLVILVVKEVIDGIMGLMILKKSGEVHSADWHGKVTTALVYAVMILHVLWSEIPKAVSVTLLLLCTGMLLFSFVLYLIRNSRQIRGSKESTEKTMPCTKT